MERNRKKTVTAGRLPIGTKLYFVIENICDRKLTDGGYHFEIISGEIDAVHEFEGSRKPEYRVPTVNRLGHGSCLEYPRYDNLGKSFWLTYAEAVYAAERMSDDYENRFGYGLRQPLIRPWRKKVAR